MDCILEARALHKAFGGRPVLRGVELCVHAGEVLVIIGRSGCGKSVLLRHLIGLLKPDAGRVLVEGVDIVPLGERALNRVRLRFGMVFQDAALFDSLSVFENVAFGLREHARLGEAELRARVRECLSRVGLEGVEAQFPETLSGGMRKRVGLARAIALAPRIILYDEPTAGLDRLTAQGINELLVRLNGELGVTSVVVTHDIESARSIADRIALLEDGRVLALGTTDELLASNHEVVRAFLARAGEPGKES